MLHRTKPVTLFLVEDDDVDAMAVERAMKKQRILNPVVRAVDGVDALDQLRHPNRVGRPFIILLDINMPRMDGIQFLDELRQDSGLSQSPVFVMTSSEAETDKFAAYERHVSGYIVKDELGNCFQDVVAMIDCYWRIVELPYSK